MRRASPAPAACASSSSASAVFIGPNRLWKYRAAAVAVPTDAAPPRTSRNPVTRTAARPVYSATCSRM
ncbi:hypothetical protein [Actinomadura madurae]|uniref:hypothetical protein n=1 Tax=Actinomadura madurae TaxID=1993 RepID=UPI0020D202C7|nr:hypothetical protein [Actinomadura madurae]MCQ0018981.1 hypothetical protein [Actinomadura madurae]